MHFAHKIWSPIPYFIRDHAQNMSIVVGTFGLFGVFTYNEISKRTAFSEISALNKSSFSTGPFYAIISF